MLPRRVVAFATVSRRTLSRNRQQCSEIGWQGALVRQEFFSSQSRPDEETTVIQNQELEPCELTTDTGATTAATTTATNKPTFRRRKTPGPSSGNERDRTKWRAPFWLPPNHKNDNNNNNNNTNNNAKSPKKKHGKPPQRFQTRSANRFRDATLSCRKHLDPGNSELPTSDWVEIFGALPTTSMEEVLVSIEGILKREAELGRIVDLEADWNPHSDGDDPPKIAPFLEVLVQDPPIRPEYVLDKNIIGSGLDVEDELNNSIKNDNAALKKMECFRVIKAHVVLSPFGRPTGWNLQLANPSIVHALLSYSNNARVKGNLRIGWKFAKVKEHFPLLHTKTQESNNNYDPKDTSTMLVVSDSMVRFENCPHSLTEDYLRHMMSRYELTPLGSTIIKWKGETSDGRVPPPTFVVRFASPAYARAAVRELQGKAIKGRPMKLIQYPKQLL